MIWVKFNHPIWCGKYIYLCQVFLLAYFIQKSSRYQRCNFSGNFLNSGNLAKIFVFSGNSTMYKRIGNSSVWKEVIGISGNLNLHVLHLWGINVSSCIEELVDMNGIGVELPIDIIFPGIDHGRLLWHLTTQIIWYSSSMGKTRII